MQFHIEDSSLTITLQGAETLLALKRQLVVPRASVERAAWHDRFMVQRRHLGWRLGTALPGVLFAGTFIGEDGRNFLYIQQPRGLFTQIEADHVLELLLNGYAYRRILLTMQSADIAEQVIGWAQGRD